MGVRDRPGLRALPKGRIERSTRSSRVASGGTMSGGDDDDDDNDKEDEEDGACATTGIGGGILQESIRKTRS